MSSIFPQIESILHRMALGKPMTKDETRRAIRVACEKRGWSVLDLAGKTQVSPEAIRRFVTGTEMSPRVLIRLLKALGLDSDSR